MICIDDKKKCSGCTACFSSCPVNAIEMLADDEGFLYPKVNAEICIECHKCERVCPIQNHTVSTSDLKVCFAAKNNIDEDRSISSSGGMFIAFAKKILVDGGIVFGCELNEAFLAHHVCISTKQQLPKLVGSKYMQSELGTIFKTVKDNLVGGKRILFCGTSCQIGGLKSFLGKDYNNLICLDFICLGVPSPKIWNDYLHTFFDTKEIESINFKDKSKGWHSFSLRVNKKVNNSFVKIGAKTYFFAGYFKGFYSRPCCSECIYKYDENRISDITISDCWGSEHIAPEMDDNKGLSSVVVHSEKGMDLFNDVKDNLVYKQANLDDVKLYNSGYCTPRAASEKRAKFWQYYEKNGAKRTFKKYCRPVSSSILFRGLRKIKHIICKGM